MKQKYIFFCFLSFVLFFNDTIAQEDSSKFTFLPRGTYFYPILLDPTECQTSVGLFKLWETGNENSGVYIPANLGFQQSIIRYKKNENNGIEFGFGGAVFTQFTIKKVEDDAYLGEMENTDYKLSFFLNYKHEDFSLRLRAFHVSSHLADDYILRNQITEANPGTLNYEQIDLTGSYQFNNLRIYGGLGMVITPNAVRERFSAQTGFIYRKSKNPDNMFRFLASADIKIIQQNNFVPNLRTGLGFEFGNAERAHLGFLIEYYNGHLPYSILEYKKVQWAGASLILLSPRR